MFVDSVKVYARAGHGGNGCVAFLREAYRPKGGPSGGDGGDGGDVILEADHDVNNLVSIYYTPRLLAKNGLPGQGKNKKGKSGLDLIIKVPCGTTIWKDPDPVSTHPSSQEAEVQDDDDEADIAENLPGRVRHRAGVQAMEYDLEVESESEVIEEVQTESQIVADLTEHGQRWVLCKGGRGGKGNRHFATARFQSPRFSQPGEAGQEGSYRFELRMLAQVGLVGYPNAGKSTLLKAISKARPKIAPYPFTTLHPQIGVVEYEDYHRLTVCDIPGLIDGAHRNVGLGHAFLRHIQRCQILVLLLDMAGMDGRKPWDDFHQLREELSLYDPALAEKPFLIVANKMDLEEARDYWPKFRRRIKHPGLHKLTAIEETGIASFKQAIREALEDFSSQGS